MGDRSGASGSARDDLAVVLLGPSEVAGRTAAAVSHRAVAASEAGEVADVGTVIGVATEPWPAFAGRHEEIRTAVAPAAYFAVQAWHRHPAYVERLAAALTRTRAATGDDVHVLFTAPGPRTAPEPEDVVFLREAAEAVSRIAAVTRRSIAWTSGTLGPSTQAALTALAEAHGRARVLRCSLDPLARPDDVTGEAAALGLELTEATLAGDDLPAILDAVVATVVEHEQLAGSGR